MLPQHSVSQNKNICPQESDLAYNSVFCFLEQTGTNSQAGMYKKQIKSIAVMVNNGITPEIPVFWTAETI